MLTLKTIQELQLKQKELDKFIWENYQKRNNVIADNTIQTKDSFIRIKIALFVEIGELANELKTFKHWKSQKDVNWDKAKEELIDCLHFYLSWANSLQIDFADYKFRKLVSEPSYNELLLAFFSETELFSTSLPLDIRKQTMIAANEKSWEKYKSEGKINEKDIEDFRRMKEGQKQIIEKMSNNLLTEIEVEKNRTSFYRWLIIFEEVAQKMRSAAPTRV